MYHFKLLSFPFQDFGRLLKKIITPRIKNDKKKTYTKKIQTKKIGKDKNVGEKERERT